MKPGNVNIRPFTESDILNRVRWINDCENSKFLHYELLLDEDKTWAWFHRSKNRADCYDATIEYDRNPVGIIGLLFIVDGWAEYYITLRESRYRGKGIVRDVSILLLKYVFDELDLLEIYLCTEVDNTPAQRLFEKCGFMKHRLDKNSAVNRGTLVDRSCYSITASEFRENSKGEQI